MIDIAKPVEIKSVIVETKKNYAPMQSFVTRQEAVDYQKKHGGFISYGITGKWMVLFVPEKE